MEFGYTKFEQTQILPITVIKLATLHETHFFELSWQLTSDN